MSATFNARHRFAFWSWAATLFLALLAPDAFGQYQNATVFSTYANKGRSPLSVNCTLTHAATMSPGKAEVTITDLTGRSKMDRNLYVVLYTKNWGLAADAICFRQKAVLTEGSASVTVKIPFAICESQISWDVRVFEDGVDIEDKRTSNLNNPRGSQSYQFSYSTNQTGTMLTIHGIQASTADPATTAQNQKALLARQETLLKAQNTQNQQFGVQVVASPMVAAFTPVPAASQDWRDYLSSSLWVVSVDAIKELSASHQLTSEAIKTYISAGGMILIDEVNSIESLNTVHTFLGHAPTTTEPIPWRSASLDNYIYWNVTHSDPSTAESMILALKKTPFAEKNFGRGKILVASKPFADLVPDDLEPLLNRNAATLVTTLTSSTSDGSWFWQNIIRSVGKPPIWAFCVIVALFGALLGPGLLYFTGRMERRSLMIFLVPTISLLATVAVIAYGIFHEGFDTHVRLFSVTAYDGPSNTAFAWSRQNYFSGMPPRKGLQFPQDAFVRPVYMNEDRNYYGMPDPTTNVRGTVNYGENQAWTNWLRPRQHQQLLVGHKADASTIPISTERTESGGLRIKNLTESTLPIVALRGAKDDYYVEFDLAPDESREPAVQDFTAASVAVSRACADLRPTLPEELASGSDSLLNFGNSGRYTRVYASSTPDIINDAMQRYLAERLELKPYSFSALVKQSDAVIVPIEGKQYENIHIAIGVEPW